MSEILEQSGSEEEEIKRIKTQELEGIKNYAKKLVVTSAEAGKPINDDLAMTASEHAVNGSGFSEMSWNFHPNFPIVMAVEIPLDRVNEMREARNKKEKAEQRSAIMMLINVTGVGYVQVEADLLPLNNQDVTSENPIMTFKITKASKLMGEEMDLTEELKRIILETFLVKVKESQDSFK